MGGLARAYAILAALHYAGAEQAKHDFSRDVWLRVAYYYHAWGLIQCRAG